MARKSPCRENIVLRRRHAELQQTDDCCQSALLRLRKAGYIAKRNRGADMRLTVSLAAAIGVFSAAAALWSPGERRHQEAAAPTARCGGPLRGRHRDPADHDHPARRHRPCPGHRHSAPVLSRYRDRGVGRRPQLQDYVLPPDGDPGHQNWYFGPDVQGKGITRCPARLTAGSVRARSRPHLCKIVVRSGAPPCRGGARPRGRHGFVKVAEQVTAPRL